MHGSVPGLWSYCESGSQLFSWRKDSTQFVVLNALSAFRADTILDIFGIFLSPSSQPGRVSHGCFYFITSISSGELVYPAVSFLPGGQPTLIPTSSTCRNGRYVLEAQRLSCSFLLVPFSLSIYTSSFLSTSRTTIVVSSQDLFMPDSFLRRSFITQSVKCKDGTSTKFNGSLSWDP